MVDGRVTEGCAPWTPSSRSRTGGLSPTEHGWKSEDWQLPLAEVPGTWNMASPVLSPFPGPSSGHARFGEHLLIPQAWSWCPETSTSCPHAHSPSTSRPVSPCWPRLNAGTGATWNRVGVSCVQGGPPHLGVPPVGKKAATALKGETGCGVGVLCLLCAVDSCLWEGLFPLPHPRESLCWQANAVEGMSQPQAVTPEECDITGAYREGSLPTLFVTCSKEHRRLCPGIRPLFVWKA